MSVKQTAETAREKAIEAYDSARDNRRDAGRKAGDGIDEAPLIALGRRAGDRRPARRFASQDGEGNASCSARLANG